MADYQKSKKAPNLRSFMINDPGLAMKEKYGQDYERYREKWSKTGNREIANDFPIHLDIDIVNSCNLNCWYCPESSLEKWTGFKMDKKNFLKIINEAEKEGLNSINLGYNSESLIDIKLFFEFLDILDKSSIMDIFIHTNALNFTTEVQERILVSNIKTICFSLGEVEDRGKNLEKIKERIISFKTQRDRKNKKLPAIRIGIIPTHKNKKRVKEYVDFWRDKSDYIELQDVTRFSDEKIEDYKKKKFLCNNPWRRLAITPEGDIFPCCGFTHFSRSLKLGNIKNITLKQAWESIKIKDLRKALQSNNLDNYPGCKKCHDCLYSIEVDLN